MLVLLGIGGAALAQGQPGLNELAIHWVRGRFMSPVMCELDGHLVQGVRRVLLAKVATPGRPAGLSIQFVDMRPGDATRCVNAMGVDLPNLTGKLQLRRPGRDHPETAARDFKKALREDRGFDFEIFSGRLRVQHVSDPPSAPEVVDFSGGRASVSVVMPATDAQRELAHFVSSRKHVLTIERKSGERLVFPIVDPDA
jgi:hypothetical protein